MQSAVKQKNLAEIKDAALSEFFLQKKPFKMNNLDKKLIAIRSENNTSGTPTPAFAKSQPLKKSQTGGLAEQLS